MKHLVLTNTSPTDSSPLDLEMQTGKDKHSCCVVWREGGSSAPVYRGKVAYL